MARFRYVTALLHFRWSARASCTHLGPEVCFFAPWIVSAVALGEECCQTGMGTSDGIGEWMGTVPDAVGSFVHCWRSLRGCVLDGDHSL